MNSVPSQEQCGFCEELIADRRASRGFQALVIFLLVCVARNYLKEWSLLGLATATLLLFTPAGYYLNSFSSEACTIFLTLCGLYCIEWNRRQCYLPFFFVVLSWA